MSLPQREIQSYTEKTAQLVFWSCAIMLILISCSFLPLCLLFILFGSSLCGPSLLLHNLYYFIPVLGNDTSQVPWVKIQLIGPFLTTQDNPLHSAHSLIKVPQVPQDLPTWVLTWPVLFDLVKQQLQFKLMLSCIIMPASKFLYHQEMSMHHQQMITKGFKQGYNGLFFQIHFNGISCLHVCCCFSCVHLFCNFWDCSPPGSSAHGILQARILEWVTMPSSRESSWPMDRTRISYVSCIGKQVFFVFFVFLFFLSLASPGKPL